MATTAPAITTRPARLTDIADIHRIQTHYVEHTVMNFSYIPASLEDMQAGYQKVIDARYPYLVATTAESGRDGRVVGYAYAHPFRERLAYQYTAELSIFVDPAWTSRGVGKVLMDAVVGRLEAESRKAEKWEKQRPSPEQARPRDVHQLMACMSVEPDPELADKLRRFYEREGFVETARLKKVGWKFGQWLDTRYMQRELKAGEPQAGSTVE